MGLLQSLLWPGQDDPCPATGLTPRDKAAVRATWQLVRKDITLNGEALLVMFFETHPEHQKLFAAFAGSAPADLRGDKRLRAHANSVMYAVTSVVDNLDEPDVLVEMLKKLGASHRRHHVPQQGFVDLKGVILRLLSEKLGGKFTPAARQGWGKALDVVNAVVFQGMEGQEEGEEASRSP
ncbi:globin-like [Bacillus rossius redtenbacheri]|uniref:globin-like n=1 Tax=Bacillus rossius redtenbacheri TaxID=93214 RepID=UPI002FDDD398